MYEPLTPNNLPNNPENSDTFINKAVLTVASYTRTVYYKYNRILVLYHLPFAFMETNWKMGLFKHSVFMCSINCLFLFICLLIFGDLTELILPLSICVALRDFYYMYLFFQDMEDDFNRLVDFLIHFWVSFQNFINALQMLLNNLPWRQLIQFNGIIIWN